MKVPFTAVPPLAPVLCGALLLLLLPQGLFAAPLAAQVPVQLPPLEQPDSGIAPPADTPTLTQGVWLWTRTEYSDGSVVRSPNPNVYTVAFADNGRVAVRADCNTGAAPYSVDDNVVSIQQAVVTLTACPPGSQGPVFVRDLLQTATYAFDGPRLVLSLRSDAGDMIFSPQSLTGLRGPTWRVTGYSDGQGRVVSAVPGTQLSMMFDDHSRVSGNSGCNLFTGTYTLSGSTIGFGALASTRRACPSDEATRQEAQFLAALDAAATYELSGDRLTFRDAQGEVQVVAVRPTVEPPPRQP